MADKKTANNVWFVRTDDNYDSLKASSGVCAIL